jgi:hypothetical protein
MRRSLLPGRRRADPRPNHPLSADPRIEALEERRDHERTRTRWHLAAWVLVVGAFGVAQWLVGSVFAVPLAIFAAALGVAWDRWQAAVADDQRIERDLRALTSVYHESPLTIRKWLSESFIHDSIRNLLAAALNSEPLAHGYWQQGVRPFLSESERGFKANWRYHIDLADLEDDVELSLDGQRIGSIACDQHRRLHTSVTYMQRIPNPAEVYYVAAVFDGPALPGWFKRPNFLLREVVVVPREVIDALPPRDPVMEVLPESFAPGPLVSAVGEPIGGLAASLLEARVSVGEQELPPSMLLVDQSGISWGFTLDDELRGALKRGSEIRVEIETFMSREQRHFPVVIAAPTQNPIVHFNYAMTDIEVVETETFFSAERPWDARLCSRHPEYKRVDIVTEPHDWVFSGSGCIFMWRGTSAATPGQGAAA